MMEETSPDFNEDLCPTRKRAVSISSVDSEPIKQRPKNDEEGGHKQTRTCDGATGSANSSSCDDEADDDEHVRVKGTRRPHLLPPEVRDVDIAGPGTESDVDGGGGGGALVDWTAVVPAHRVSEAAVGVVTSTTPSSHVCVAEVLKRTLTMDVGTRFCLADGRSVGVLISLLGPVQDPLYLVSCSVTPETRSQVEEHVVVEGTRLHYDLAHQHIVYSPATQCDVARGTDASYVNDDELPGNVRPDFSDDGEELRWKREHKARKLADKDAESVSSEDEPVADVEWAKIDLDWDDADGSSAQTKPSPGGGGAVPSRLVQ